jgi:hypothetical protein
MKINEDDGKVAENFQRVGAKSNAQVGREFENSVNKILAKQGFSLSKNYKIAIGVDKIKKLHAFDLGSSNPRIIVECKSHKWTAGNNTPSAKMTVWNEAMYYFAIAPADYQKLFFVLRDYSESRKVTLAEYYIRTYEHLIPADVEIWEYDPHTENTTKLK